MYYSPFVSFWFGFSALDWILTSQLPKEFFTRLYSGMERDDMIGKCTIWIPYFGKRVRISVGFGTLCLALKVICRVGRPRDKVQLTDLHGTCRAGLMFAL
ncbi:hypothetical protein BO78DRAFT_225273 [Aspergillus sclerotiicarbonarius CBS 121057]|uniref:Uncharacterized protein n=1 Tax=Aspergillus sclerotiicarbonarius (strain CBS 121057 / IBT 28362) TaxID=1448318 RepID=A0A319DYF2_ASPSB|nr:hypothetical protein BO78DRAFT_225273 [Aspergillus sclerotiicarbonarius CBS 121057]